MKYNSEKLLLLHNGSTIIKMYNSFWLNWIQNKKNLKQLLYVFLGNIGDIAIKYT